MYDTHRLLPSERQKRTLECLVIFTINILSLKIRKISMNKSISHSVLLLIVISVTTSLGIHPASAQQVSPIGCPVSFVCTQNTPKINISQASVSVGDRLEVYGSNFTPINAVLFDGVSSGRIASEDGSSISVIIPASLKAGSHNLAIQNVYGTSTAASF